jgi:hypothetical protein
VVLAGRRCAASTIEAAYSVFEPGRFIEETGPAKTVHFVGAEVQLRF